MAVGWKLVIDCADPLAQVEFWSRALGYETEDNRAIIDRLLGAGVISEDDYIEVEGRRNFRTLAAVRHPDDEFDPATGTGLGRRLLFQAVPEPKQGKNRLHIDLHVDPDHRESEVKRLESLGATVLHHVEAQGGVHVTMADPEGNEFDVQ